MLRITLEIGICQVEDSPFELVTVPFQPGKTSATFSKAIGAK